MKKAFSVFIVLILITLQSSGIFAGGYLADISDADTTSATTKVSLDKLSSLSSIIVVINSSLGEQMKRLLEVSGSVGSLADNRSQAPSKKEKAKHSNCVIALMPSVNNELVRSVVNFSDFGIISTYSSYNAGHNLLLLAFLMLCFGFIRTLMLRYILFLPRAGIEYSIKKINILGIKSLIDLKINEGFFFSHGGSYVN